MDFNLWVRLGELGITGIMLYVFIRLFRSQYKDYKELITSITAERKAFYDEMKDLIAEVTVALTNKNNSDYEISKALEKLTDAIKDQNGKTEN